jgi:hypothetical protein
MAQAPAAGAVPRARSSGGEATLTRAVAVTTPAPPPRAAPRPSAARLRDAAWPLLASRAVVWLVAMPAVLHFGYASWRARADPTNITGTLGSVGHVIGAPVMRWDSVYYVQIAQHGYTQLKQAGFFPLYPLLMSVLDDVVGSTVVAGALISLLCFAGGLLLFDRLALLETGRASVARRSVWLLALFPASLFFSAVYTEALFLVLSVGAFLAARQGRWWLAGLLGGLAAATRNVGVTLLVPLVILYFWGPREDRPPDRAGRVRYKVRAEALWLGLVPLGCAAVAFFMWRKFDDPLTAWTSQESYFGRHFEGPFSGVVLGFWKPLSDLGHGMLGSAVNKGALFVVCAGALAIAVSSFKRLPAAYGAYAIAALAPALSTPRDIGPLNGSIRYVAVVFPLFLWLGMALEGRRRLTWVVGAAFTLGLAYCSARFATWRWVA